MHLFIGVLLFCIIDNMETTMKVKICPFCGHHGHELTTFTVAYDGEDGGKEIRRLWQMKCRCCGAMGPTEGDPRFAIESWNILYRNPAHDDDPMEEDFTYDADEKESEIDNGKTEEN